MAPDSGQGPATDVAEQAHEAPIVVGGRTMPRTQRDKAYVAAVQRDINRHLERLGWGRRLAIDGEWDDATQRAFERVCRLLGIEAERGQRTFQIIAGTAAERTPEELERARTDGAAFAERLRALFQKQVAQRDEQRLQAAAALPARVVGGRPLTAEQREHAYVAAVQRDLNVHLQRLGSDEVLAVDGKWDAHTEQAFQRVCTILGVRPERSRRVFRIIGGAISARTEAEREHAAQQGALEAQRLQARFLERRLERLRRGPELPAKTDRPGKVDRPDKTDRPDKAERRDKVDRPDKTDRRDKAERPDKTDRPDRTDRPDKADKPKPVARAQLIDRNGGNGFGRLIVEKADEVGLPLVLACALVDLESTFRNVFGHDDVANPIPKGSRVTKESYRRYLAFRGKGLGNQGVGLTQLTFHTIQDEADRKGGCWKPAVQLEVGFQLLVDHMQRLGKVNGIRRYNGDPADPKTRRYLDKFRRFERKWSQILRGAAGPDNVGKAPRTLRGGHKGRDVALLQETLNGYYRRWGAPDLLDRDGDLGKATMLAFVRVAAVLGLAVKRGQGGRILIPPEQRLLLRHPERRTREQLERARTDGAAVERKLRKRFARQRRRRGRRPKVIDLGRGLAFGPMSRATAAIHTIVGHHTASPRVDTSDRDAIALCKTFHNDHRSKNPPWAGIGYHACIARSGTVILLRPGSFVGAGVLGHNTGTFHVTFIGNFDHHRPSEAQLRSYRWFVEHGDTLRNVPRLPKRRRGHRDLAATDCPGDNLIQHLRGN